MSADVVLAVVVAAFWGAVLGVPTLVRWWRRDPVASLFTIRGECPLCPLRWTFEGRDEADVSHRADVRIAEHRRRRHPGYDADWNPTGEGQT